MALADALGADLAALHPTEPVTVAIVDSGIDATHPDLVGRVVRAFRTTQVDGKPRLDEIAPDTNNDTFGHGTGVASIIARLAPNARLVDIRVLQAGNKGSGEELVIGLGLAVRERCPVINMSLAAPLRFVDLLIPLCESAHYRGLTVVAAKRNVPITDEGFPAELSSVIGVDTDTLPSPFSFRFRDGRVIEIEALGEEVPAAVPGGGYTTLTGTSFATPTISGLCARLLGVHPGLRPFELRAILRHLANGD